MQRNFRANVKPPDPKDDLLLYKKMREMICYGNECLNNAQFPRKYRIGNGIGVQIETAMYEAFNLVVEANAKEHKATTLRAADGKLKYLRQLITIASDPQFDKNTIILPYKKQLIWSEKLIEIGKLIGS